MSGIIQRLVYVFCPPKIVCLVGSTKFQNSFEKENLKFSLDGWIVLSVATMSHYKGVNLDIAEPEVKKKLNALYLKKIEFKFISSCCK